MRATAALALCTAPFAIGLQQQGFNQHKLDLQRREKCSAGTRTYLTTYLTTIITTTTYNPDQDGVVTELSGLNSKSVIKPVFF